MAYSRAHVNQPLGDLIALDHHDHRLTLRTTEGYVRIVCYGLHTVRIRISRSLSAFESDFSYAVPAWPAPQPFSLVETDTHYHIDTDHFRLEIGRQPVRFRLLTPGGAVVNEDDPAFGTSWIGQEVTTYKKLQSEERFVGMGEKTGPLDRRGRAYTHWNTDYFDYPPEGDPLYCSTPFYIGLHSGLQYGVFLDSTFRTHVNFGASNDRFASFAAEDGEMDYYLFYAPTVSDILRAYTDLTGRMPLPPRWSLGYQQCRYSYYPDHEVLRVARAFREKGLPADVIYLDIHYMEDYKIFTWHPDRFPDPAGLLAELRAMGFRVVVILDPGIKVEAGYPAYEQGLQHGLFVQYPDGAPFTAQVWPGWCHFPDFTRADTRQWWGYQMEGLVRDGVAGFWNDMNEPASWGQRMPDLIEFDYEGQGATHKRAHNAYGMQMARATYEGAQRWRPQERPFVLTRAGYAGIQRYAAIWTGDNQATDDHMLVGVRLVCSLGLAGVPFAGFDVGGFVGEITPALYARWVSIGAFTPFFRGHSMINSRAAEPWTYGEEAAEIAANYLRLRYRLLPYLYACFDQASRTGLPVARSLVLDYPHDAHIFREAYQNQYLFGPALLVVPGDSRQDYLPAYLPKGTDWYDFYTDQRHAGGQALVVAAPPQRLPVFVRAGAIVPMQAPAATAAVGPGDTLFLHIYAHTHPSDFTLYEDDGLSEAYREGNFHRRRLVLNPLDSTLFFEEATGDYAPPYREIRVYFHGFGPVAAVRLGAEPLRINQETVVFLQPLSDFDPFLRPDDGLRAPEVSVVTLPYRSETFALSWGDQ